MGLDMYLDRSIFIGAEFACRNVRGVIDISAEGKHIDIDLSKVSYIYEHVAYWRKANMIHKWFVDNFADGNDDCRWIFVPKKSLIELRDLCKQILALPAGKNRDENAMAILPTQDGFFFGGTDIGDWYYDDLQYTVDALKDVEKYDSAYRYSASW